MDINWIGSLRSNNRRWYFEKRRYQWLKKNDGIYDRSVRTKGGNGLNCLDRFGWKAASATPYLQTVNANNDDMGITKPTEPYTNKT